ncbi:MAG: DUF3794 domain-containing protein [Oscillospiraceae bacterium]|nr:DUF3794 domain-containing protein [Oscillospiraceae bacterium]
MEITAATGRLGACETVFDVRAEVPAEGEFTIPDYQPEIWKIVKTKAEPVVVSRLAVGARATVEGYVKLSVLYGTKDDQRLCALSQRIPFSKQFELKEPVGDRYDMFTDVGADYLNCRAVNGRKIDVRGALSLSVRILSCADVDVVTAVDGAFCRSESAQYLRSVAGARKQFTLDELLQADVPENAQPTILRCEASALVESAVCFENRAEIKGVVYACAALELAEEDGFTVRRSGFKLPFSQIVDLDGVSEASAATATAAVLSCTALPELTEDGLISLSVSCELSVDAYAHESVDYVGDAFSTSSELLITRATPGVTGAAWAVCEPFTYSDGFDKQPGQLIDYFLSRCHTALVVENGAAFAETAGALCIVLADAGGGANGFDVPFSFRRPLQMTFAGMPFASLECVFDTLECVESDTRISLKATGFINGSAVELLRLSAVLDVRADAAHPKTPRDMALCAYYADAGEDVFSIAARFNTSPRAIAEENGVDVGVLAQPTVLLIPIVEQ